MKPFSKLYRETALEKIFHRELMQIQFKKLSINSPMEELQQEVRLSLKSPDLEFSHLIYDHEALILEYKAEPTLAHYYIVKMFTQNTKPEFEAVKETLRINYLKDTTTYCVLQKNLKELKLFKEKIFSHPALSQLQFEFTKDLLLYLSKDNKNTAVIDLLSDIVVNHRLSSPVAMSTVDGFIKSLFIQTLDGIAMKFNFDMSFIMVEKVRLSTFRKLLKFVQNVHHQKKKDLWQSTVSKLSLDLNIPEHNFLYIYNAQFLEHLIKFDRKTQNAVLSVTRQLLSSKIGQQLQAEHTVKPELKIKLEQHLLQEKVEKTDIRQSNFKL